MILDNQTEETKICNYIPELVESGKLDIVTGYFTIGALAYLSEQVNSKIEQYRLILGDIVSTSDEDFRPLDLLNENITIEAALKLSTLAKEAVAFLKQQNVEAKTLEPNFCHAKTYLYSPHNMHDKKNARNAFFITGSSNLTEAGIGLKATNNIELNIAETGDNGQYKEFAQWFDNLWTKPQAHTKKTVKYADGRVEQILFKEYLISQIEQLFIKYTPKEIYYKILFELFGSQVLADQYDPEFNRQIGRLENSVVYNSLYEFQKKGVLSLIRMLQKYNGAILADAVGLGKTWSALAVIKFFQRDHEVVLLCPKKLEQNWQMYLKNRGSRFDKDSFDYIIRYHTDLMDGRMDRDGITMDSFFNCEKRKLFVIDESHNLRNDKSNRYKFFLEQILKKNLDAKVLMLSATPINNSLNDIRNQFKLIVKGHNDGFAEDLGIRNLEGTFKVVTREFNDWKETIEPKISDFIKKLPSEFFKLTDSLVVARTRKMIVRHQTDLYFPKKEKPDNVFVTPKQMGNFESFEELFNHFPPRLSGYLPAFYVKDEKGDKKNVLHDERQRDYFLVKMMYILMVKRLESSWMSFYLTVEKIRDHHQNALNKITRYQSLKKDEAINEGYEDLLDEENEDELNGFTLGKKRKISLKEIDDAGMLDLYKKDLKEDLDALDNLFVNLEKFDKQIKKEVGKTNSHASSDEKLAALIKIIKDKRAAGHNINNQKVIIFTVYKDTAEYLFNQLKSRGFNKIGVVSGSGSQTDDSNEVVKNFEPILERFAPYTKLYKEKEWDFTTELRGIEAFDEWREWIKKNDKKTSDKLTNGIDILIATDALSEGQNLQDADMVVNYDIHWNPVRIIQRMGRIDRLGSINEKIFGVNFWPSNNINTYLNLQGRIEQRMAAMKLAGSEVHSHLSDDFEEMVHDESLDRNLNDRMMEQMQLSFDDIEENNDGLGFDNLSLEKFRQELLSELNEQRKKYERMPNGVYTGFIGDDELCTQRGIAALLGYPAKPAKQAAHEYTNYDLVYINMDGEQVLLNQKEVLDALREHRDDVRFVPEAIEMGDEKAIQELSDALKTWLQNQAKQEPADILEKLKRGNITALARVKENKTADTRYQQQNYDLIAWSVISK